MNNVHKPQSNKANVFLINEILIGMECPIGNKF